MHVLTLAFVLLELMMCSYQLVYYFSRPQDKCRLWYLVLLGLLIVYNVTGGLFPDPGIGISIVLQNILAYGAGFLISAYFPFYFYKCFNLKRLRIHALYGAPLLLLLPYVLFFVLIYPMVRNLDFVIRYGMIVPFFYSLVLLVVILNAIRLKAKQKKVSPYPYRKGEMLSVYCAVVPWASMSVFSYFHVSQWIEVLVTNSGFVWVTVLFIVRSAALARIEHEQLLLLLAMDDSQRMDFSRNCQSKNLTAREIEIVELLCTGLTNTEIGDALFISVNTVESHVHNIFEKTGAKRRIQLPQILGFGAAGAEVRLAGADVRLRTGEGKV